MNNQDDKNRGGFNKPFAQKFQNQSPSNRPPQHNYGRDDDRNNEKSLDEMWRDYLKHGYFDAEGNLQIELVERENLQNLIKEMTFAKPKLTSNQLRRFFQHCRAVESRILSKQSVWEKERAAFMQIDSAAADAYGKQDKKIPKIFHDFIQRNVAAVKTEKDFMKGFITHFEALVGFAAQYLEREKK